MKMTLMTAVVALIAIAPTAAIAQDAAVRANTGMAPGTEMQDGSRDGSMESERYGMLDHNTAHGQPVGTTGGRGANR